MALFLSQISKPRDSSRFTRFSVAIFNNVKSDLKIILYQPNKVVFKVKVLSL